MDNKDTIKERLLKIYRLAEGGEDGEKDTAQRMLDEQLKKFGLTMDDLIETQDEKQDIYWFCCKDRYQRQLLEQIYAVFFVKSIKFSTYNSAKYKYHIGLKLSKSQHLEFSLMYDFYINQWKKELEKQKETLLMAFISKHKIALRAANVSAMSPEELKKAKRVCDMMNDLENVSYHQKRLPCQKELHS